MQDQESKVGKLNQLINEIKENDTSKAQLWLEKNIGHTHTKETRVRYTKLKNKNHHAGGSI